MRRHILEQATAVADRVAADPRLLAVYELPQIIANVRAWILGILFAVATLFATVAAARYISAKDPADVEKAKSALKSALLGYALAILAPVLLTIVKGWIGG